MDLLSLATGPQFRRSLCALLDNDEADNNRIRVRGQASSSRGQICLSAPFDVLAAMNGAGVAATNRAILAIDRESTSAIISPVAVFMRMTITRAALF